MKRLSSGATVGLGPFGDPDPAVVPRFGNKQNGLGSVRDTGGSRYLRKKVAAQYLGICERTLTSLMKSRAIPYFKMTRGIALFEIADLDRAMQRYRVRPVGEESK